MEERVTDLEIRITHQERTIHELSETVFVQQRAIERLERELRLVKEQLSAAVPSLNRNIDEEEPPPHY